MINKLLRKLGFIKFLTEEELLNEYVMRLEADLSHDKVFKAKEAEIFDQVRTIDGISDYLRETIVRDTKRYFGAQSPMEQCTIRGASSRTVYFKGLLSIKKGTEETKKNLKSDRHA